MTIALLDLAWQHAQVRDDVRHAWRNKDATRSLTTALAGSRDPSTSLRVPRVGGRWSQDATILRAAVAE